MKEELNVANALKLQEEIKELQEEIEDLKEELSDKDYEMEELEDENVRFRLFVAGPTRRF